MSFKKNGSYTLIDHNWEANNVLKVEKDQVWEIEVDGVLKVRFKFSEANFESDTL